MQAHPRRRRALGRLAVALGLASALLLSGFLVYQASSAAFTATTVNGTNSWTAGSLALTDNSSGAAMVPVSVLVPGQGGAVCIAVTYNGTVPPSAIKLYVKSGDATESTPNGGSITQNLTWAVESSATVVASGSSTACDGLGGTTLLFGDPADTTVVTNHMLADFITKNTFAGGVAATGWAPSANVASTRTFRFTYRLSSTANNTVMNSSAQVKITWEADS